MLALFAALGPRLLSFALRLGFGGIVDKTIAFMEQQASEKTGRVRIEADVRIEQIKAHVSEWREEQETRRQFAREGTARQARKMNYTVFWVIIVFALGPGVFMMWATALYNIFWHANGIWPQPWDIAAFQPQNLLWINMSIQWLFDPYGLPSTIGTATVAARVMR